jgi:hypothetical protein
VLRVWAACPRRTRRSWQVFSVSSGLPLPSDNYTKDIVVYLLPMSHLISHLIFVLSWCCFFSGGMFHYDCGSSVYGISHAEGHMFRKVPENPLINEFGAYIISKLHKFQNMKCFMVHEDTVIADYVRHRTTLHDGTVVHCFSKELLAFLETLVAFSPYYRANDPRAAGAMDTYYTDTLRDYGGVSFDDLHDCLTPELTDWYARFPPAKAVDSDEEGPAGGANVGDVVDIGPAQPTNAFSAGPLLAGGVQRLWTGMPAPVARGSLRRPRQRQRRPRQRLRSECSTSKNPSVH